MIINKPIKCQYYLTLDCNARCSFCDFPTNKKYRHGFARLDDIKKNLPALKKLGVKYIDYTGGEPLLHKGIIEILRLTKKYRILTRLSTNGILYKKYAHELVGLVDYLVFSLQGPTKEINNRVMGIDCYDNLIESIKLAKRLRQNPELFFVVSNENFDYIKDMMKLAKGLDVRLIFNPVYSYFNNPGLDAKKLRLLKKYAHGRNLYVNSAIIEFNLNRGNDTNKPRCYAVDSVINITPDSCLALPCFNYYFKKIKINNDLEKIYNSAYVQNLKKGQGRWSFCRGCNLSCYFNVSFFYKLDKYFLLSLISGMKYTVERKIKSIK